MIGFNALLEDAGVEPKLVQLVRHKDTRSTAKVSPYILWLHDDKTEFGLYQSLQGKKVFKVGHYLASFVVSPRGEVLFVGLYLVKSMATGAKGFFCPSSGADCSNHFRYELVLQQKLSDYVGLLTVEWNVGARSWIQHAAKQNKTVREIRAKRSEKEWPGFRNFIEPLKDIDKIPKAWQEILTHSQGIYLLTCQNTGMSYIGSAKSEKGGFWQRFCAYKKDGHGGNKELKNFDTSHMQITILERVDPGNMQIIEIETTWKNKLRTRVSHGPQGLNAN